MIGLVRVRLVPYGDAGRNRRIGPEFRALTVEDALEQAMDYNWVIHRYPDRHLRPVIAQQWDTSTQAWVLLDLEKMVREPKG
ncbi:hypothetical protein ABIE44_003396 [Marmoricola sp. OAE513]